VPSNEAIPFYRPGQDITCKAGVALTGKRLCAITGNRSGGPGLGTDLQNLYVVGLPAAGGRVLGVVGYDVGAGDPVPVKREGVLPILTAGAIAAFAEVECDAQGRVITKASGVAIGVCLTGVGSGADAEIYLYK